MLIPAAPRLALISQIIRLGFVGKVKCGCQKFGTVCLETSQLSDPRERATDTIIQPLTNTWRFKTNPKTVNDNPISSE